MNGDELIRKLRHYGISQRALAKRMKCSSSTVNGWCKYGAPPVAATAIKCVLGECKCWASRERGEDGMKIEVRRVFIFTDVVVTHGHTTIQLGAMNDKEVRELAKILRDAADELDPIKESSE